MSEHEAADDHGARILRHFGPDPDSWVRPTHNDHDVVVVGGGQSGIGISFALRRHGIHRHSVIDASAPDEVGVWTTTARMNSLRTHKNRPDPEFGYPELSFQAWYSLIHGQEDYDALARIPRVAWADYISWVRRTLDVAVRFRTRLVEVVPAKSHLVLRLAVTHEDGTVEKKEKTTRKLVLANGVEGTGGPYTPGLFADLPRDRTAHTSDRIDFTALEGKTVAVLGSAASAFDAASTALEAGAREVHLYTRHPELSIQREPPLENPGVLANFPRRSDADRWQHKVVTNRARSAPLESLRRAAAFPGFRVHLAASWETVTDEQEALRVVAADGSVLLFDFLIAATGFQHDPRTRPELAGIADDIALWSDRYQPPADLADESLGRTPYLGEGFTLQEKEPGRAPWVPRIHSFSAAASIGYGYPVGDGMSHARDIPRLLDVVCRDLFFEDLTLPAQVSPPSPPVESFRELYADAVWTANGTTQNSGFDAAEANLVSSQASTH